MRQIPAKCDSHRPSILVGRLHRIVSPIAAALLFAANVWAQVTTREDGLQYIGTNLELVREQLNGDPAVLDRILIGDLARPVGDDPRVLALCEEIIDKSTNTAIIDSATACIDVIAGIHRGSISPQELPRVAASLHKALERTHNLETQLHVATAFERLGEGYRDDIDDIFRKRFKAAKRDQLSDSALIARVGCFRIPEAVSFCAQIIEKSSDENAVSAALTDFTVGIERYMSLLRERNLVPTIAKSLRKAAVRKTLPIGPRSAAIGALEKLDGAYREEAYRLYLQLLESPGDVTGERNCSILIRTIEKVVYLNREDSLASIQMSMKKCPVLALLESYAAGESPTSEKRNRRLLDSLNAIYLGERK